MNKKVINDAKAEYCIINLISIFKMFFKLGDVVQFS